MPIQVLASSIVLHTTDSSTKCMGHMWVKCTDCMGEMYCIVCMLPVQYSGNAKISEFDCSRLCKEYILQ